MKNRIISKSLLAFMVAGSLLAAAGTLSAQDAAVAVAASVPPLSPGVGDVLKMVQAKIGESTIVAFVQNSSQTYRLNAEQIIYLKGQGASNAVLDSMINHQSGIAPTYTAAPAETSTVTAAPTVTYVQTAPSSTVYVDPYPYYGYPAYYGYGWYPPVSLSFGFGGRWHGGGGGHWHR